MTICSSVNALEREGVWNCRPFPRNSLPGAKIQIIKRPGLNAFILTLDEKTLCQAIGVDNQELPLQQCIQGKFLKNFWSKQVEFNHRLWITRFDYIEKSKTIVMNCLEQEEN